MLNGRYPDSALRPIPGGRLAIGFAERWNTMCFISRAHGAGTPMPNGPMSAYRTIGQQWFLRNMWCAQGRCSNAAIPGTSNHGWGRAVDSNQRDTAYRFGGSCGIHSPSDAPWEGWHTLIRLEGRIHVAPAGPRVLRLGVRSGADVAHLKKMLRTIWRPGHKRHYWRWRWNINRKYGRLCAWAVKNYQRDHHLRPDGVVGPQTLAKIRQSAKTHH